MLNGDMSELAKKEKDISFKLETIANEGLVRKDKSYIKKLYSTNVKEVEQARVEAVVTVMEHEIETRLYNEVSKRKKEMVVTLDEFLRSMMDIKGESAKAMAEKDKNFVLEMVKILKEKVKGLKEHESDDDIGELIKSLIKNSVNSVNDQIHNYALQSELLGRFRDSKVIPQQKKQ